MGEYEGKMKEKMTGYWCLIVGSENEREDDRTVKSEEIE
jgi:hypothetical protein